MADVTLENVRKVYAGSVEAVRSVSLDIDDGSFCVLVGPSGCGKSTLLRMIAGLETITSGEVRIGARVVNAIEPSERDIAMVFQNYALYPHMNVYQNMAYGLKNRGTPKAEIEARVKEAARILAIEPFMARKPRELSGGQRQRVAMGRAIVRKPQVFLFDEPLSNLDSALRVRMRYEFAKLHQDLKTTMVYVTHDQVEAMTLADRIVVLNGGHIEQVGSPMELYDRPGNVFVAGFIGSPRMNFLPGKLVQANASEALVALPGGEQLRARVDASRAQPGEAVLVGLRPEHLHPDAGDNALQVGVTFVESLGSSTQAYCALPGVDEAITCTIQGQGRLRDGQQLRLGVRAEDVYLFDAQELAFPRTSLGVAPAS
ncbi:MAG: ABC transporter ATP-binding protein [Microvirga sp.]